MLNILVTCDYTNFFLLSMIKSMVIKSESDIDFVYELSHWVIDSTSGLPVDL